MRKGIGVARLQLRRESRVVLPWELSRGLKILSLVLALNFGCAPPSSVRGAAEKFTIATFNLENYVDSDGARPAKSTEGRAKIRESIRTARPDVIGLQEIGSTNALLELRSSLKADGLDYSFWEHVAGYDTNIHVAVLSQFPIVARRSHSRDAFLLNGRRLRMTRGIAELEIKISPRYSFTLLVAHLKSRRQSAVADQEDLRVEEALILREKVDALLRSNPNANVVVAGDFNDVKDALSTRSVIGKGKLSLVDTRPAERNGDSLAIPTNRLTSRNITWTHFYSAEDTYSRVDYILASRGMAREWDPAGSYVLALPNWGVASDHRLVIASFYAQDQ